MITLCVNDHGLSALVFLSEITEPCGTLTLKLNFHWGLGGWGVEASKSQPGVTGVTGS